MNLFYLLQKQMDRMDDYKFSQVWERRYLKNLMNVIGILGIIFVVIVFAIGFLANYLAGFLIAVLVMGSVGLILGYYMVVHFIVFLAKNNERYMKIMTNQNNSSNINYDNVVN